MENTASCHDQQVFNDTEVYLLLRKPGITNTYHISKLILGTKDEYEDLKLVSGKEFEYEYPVKKIEEVPAVVQAD